MFTLLYGCLLFIIAASIQICLGRMFNMIFSTKQIVQIFCLFYVLGFFASTFVASCSLPQWPHFTLLYAVITMAYIFFYVDRDDSPTMTLVYELHRKSRNGADKYDLKKVLTDQLVILPRLYSLLEMNLIIKQKNNFLITRKGKIYIWFTNIIRILMGFHKDIA